MSIKRVVFETALHGLAPASTYAFQVWVSGLINSNLLAVAATYPASEQGSVAVQLMGRKVEFPTDVINCSGEWACTFVETQSYMVKWELLKMLMKQQKEGKLFDINITPIQGGGVVPMTGIKLGGCWLKTKGGPKLDMANATEVWKWETVFHYNYISEPFNVDDVPVVADVKLLAALGLGKLVSSI